jgi:hypothetical protein
MKNNKKPWWSYCSYLAGVSFISGKLLVDKYETLGFALFLLGIPLAFLYFFNKAGNKNMDL